MSALKLGTIDVDNIVLNENAYFYKVIKPFKNSDVQLLFRQSKEDKGAVRKYKSIIREPYYSEEGEEIAIYSLDILEYESKPSFLKEEDDNLIEKKFSLFLIVEVGEYVAVIKRNVSGIKKIKDYIESIDYEVLSRFLIRETSKFEKIESSSMNTSSTALQRKVSEARDLKGVYSRFSASKEILNSLRIDDSKEKHSIAINTSRVNSFNLKNDFEDVIHWLVVTIELIKSAYINLPNSTFLDGFAKHIKFESIINKIKPTYLLIRFSNLLDEIQQGNIKRAYTIDSDDKERPLNLKKVIDSYQDLHKVEINEDGNYQAENIILRINKSNISLYSREFNKIKIEFENGIETTLGKYINTENHFIINFDKIEYVYMNRKIFQDSRLFENLDYFFETFIEEKELIKITSEKGQYTTSDSRFDKNSIFGYIEEKHAKNADILVCDDMATEWGDFISINDNEIIFYHAKYHDKSLSASFLEEVFGQAQKNLGYIDLNEELIESRRKKWLGKFKHNKVKTNITRLRKCPTGTDKIKVIKEYINNVSANPHLNRRVYVVINFISKKELSDAVNTLKAGKKFKNDGVILQILWFVNSLLSSSLDRNVDFRIICQP